MPSLFLSPRFFSERTLLADRFLYARPSCFGMQAQEVEFRGRGETRLRGWYIPGDKPGTLVFCPGNSNNVSCHLEYVSMIRATGHSVLAFDYRGFGRSDGVPDLRRLVDDVVSAVAETERLVGADEPIGLMGISLGAGTALAAAARLGARIRAVVVESLSDYLAMLTGLFSHGAFGPRWADEVVLPDGSVSQREFLRFMSVRFPPLAKLLARGALPFYPFRAKRPILFAPQLTEVPVFVVHGIYDALLPLEASVEFYEALRGPKRLWLIPEAGHPQEAAMSHRAEYVRQLDDFFAAAFTGGNPDEVPVERSVAGTSVTLTPQAHAFPRSLMTIVRRGQVAQHLLERGASLNVGALPADAIVSALGTSTLAGDGYPEAECDERSHEYRTGGYQDAFRALVKGMNHMDFDSCDAALTEYLNLPRKCPFDFLAAVYCLRVAWAAHQRLPGWPRVPAKFARRSLESLLEIWEAHDHLPGVDEPESPAAWARARLGDATLKEAT